MSAEKAQVFELGPESELRFEVEAENETAILKVKSGSGELFGSELLLNRPYEFRKGTSAAVFSWNGCTVELRGCTGICYVSKETTTGLYFKIHTSLEWQRRAADQSNKRGPVSMVVGSRGVGKSSLARLLVNYAVRAGRKPVLVDLDVAHGHISFPGTIGAMMVEQPASVEEGFEVQDALVYHYGHEHPSNNFDLYSKLLSNLAEAMAKGCENDKEVRASGVVIDTCGLIERRGYDALTLAAQTFEVNEILVIDNERLAALMMRDLSPKVTIVNVRKNPGVLQRTDAQLEEDRLARIHEYFYGMSRAQCRRTSGSRRRPSQEHGHRLVVSIDELKLYRVGAFNLPQTCLPLGSAASTWLTVPLPVAATPALVKSVLAVVPAPPHAAAAAGLTGFICITKVDMVQRTVTLLSPHPLLAPETTLLLSDLRYQHN